MTNFVTHALTSRIEIEPGGELKSSHREDSLLSCQRKMRFASLTALFPSDAREKITSCPKGFVCLMERT